MALKMQIPELKCLEPDIYKKYFRALCWSGTRKSERKTAKKAGKKEKVRRLKASGALAICYAPALLGNPSHFAVYASVRKTVLSRWRNLHGAVSELSDDSDNDEPASQGPLAKLPMVTGIGLKTVFALISEARYSDSSFCEHALKALLDVLQGHSPEELSQEPAEIISTLHSMLVEVAGGSGRPEIPTTLTAMSSSCLIALSVARGEAELILNAVMSLIKSPPSLYEQSIQVPSNLVILQRSVLSVMLGSPSRNQWLDFGVPLQSLVTSFPLDLTSQLTQGSAELVVRSLVSDGCYLYVFTSKGLLKIGSGYGSSIRQHVYLYKPDFFPSERHGWLGYCKDKFYVRIGRKKTELYEVDKNTLEMKHTIKLDPGEPLPSEPKSAVFSDGNQLGLIILKSFDSLLIRFYDVDNPSERNDGMNVIPSRRDLTVHLLRRRTLALGKAPFEDGLSRRVGDLDAPVAMQLDDIDDDPIVGICAGQDFGLLSTQSGKIYYTGKGTSLGYKASTPHPGHWTLMKDTVFTRDDSPSNKKCRVVQMAVGHEGVHAVLVLDNGLALFTGVARRGEDGDMIRHRRTPKPSRPKKIFKAEGHHIIYAACNYGSTALITKQGLLLMYGKDTQHCDSSGLVTGLRHERVIQVALGKAHAVALTNFGLVYTFGINNKGQCGREFGYTKERLYPSRHSSATREDVRICPSSHTFTTDYCRVCTLCQECTGYTSCQCADLPDRVPGERCGCGEGDSGCSVCGICRRCADTFEVAGRVDTDDDGNASADIRSDKDNAKYEGHSVGSDHERDASMKVSCLPPARVAVPGGHRVCAIACGLHHTVLLTENGEVLTFGSNQYGQLGAGDVSAHHRIVRGRLPRASAIAAGSNHTAVLTRDGELYTFGSYQKGSLGRPRIEAPARADRADRADRAPIWHATPERVPKLGPRHACKAVWVSASGDQTFVQVSQAVIKTDTLFSSTITANNNAIVILPNRPEHTFKCITINKLDGVCNAWPGPEQVDFVNTLTCLDPLYDVVWCYQPQMRVIKCYNILAFDSHKLQRCCNNDQDVNSAEGDEYPNYGSMKRLEDFKNTEDFELSCSNDDKPPDNMALFNMSVLNQQLAIPTAPGGLVTRIHAALHLLGCLDSLTYLHDNKLNQVECKQDSSPTPVVPVKDDFLTVNRFEGHGGGWGYSGHSVEAIRFMCDNDILLGGVGLFGGRGDYTAKVKLFDIGVEGGDQEGDGELVIENDEIVYECAPRDKFPVLFEAPVPLVANRWYVAWACINGPSSDCGSSGQAMVISDDIGFHFKTSKQSNNGTDVNAGQIPSLLYNTISPEHPTPVTNVDIGDPIIILSRNLSRKVTVDCFKSLITLLQWSWQTFKEILLETNGQVSVNYQKLVTMKHQKRLVYIIRCCLRLVKSYVNEIYPQNKNKRNAAEYSAYTEVVSQMKSLIQALMADPIPTCAMLPRKPVKNKALRACNVQFALDMTNSILKEAHDTVTACFHAFFPSASTKWHHLCGLLFYVKDGTVPQPQIAELTATCAALCGWRSLKDMLQYIVPITQCCLTLCEGRIRTASRSVKEVPAKSATVPRSSQKPPPIPPRAINREVPKPVEPSLDRFNSAEWHLLDLIAKLLDIVMMPMKSQMMTRQCGQPHDHGELKQHERVSEFCCKLIARIVAELTYSASMIREDRESNMIKHLVTPSRFMRVNSSRAWNTGNGSPDAICFTVDRPGVMLVGVCVYGGPGTYEYSLELLHDVRLRTVSDDPTLAHCWVSLEVAHGVFSSAECAHDVVQLRFDRPVPLKEDLRYAVRLCNHGGRTANGDCGLPSVKGPDDTTFRFASCSLSFNGTTLARGQIPSLIYYGTSKIVNAPESHDSLIQSLRNITLNVTKIVMERSVQLFQTLRNELTAEDLKRNASVLQNSPAVNILIPFTLAHLEGFDDPKCVVRIIEMVQKLVPHVAAMNLLIPSVEEVTTTATHYYTWVESDHPYTQATVSNMRVLFPPNVSWVVLEMDPRSITAQPEDTLTIYAVAGAPKNKCTCANEVQVTETPFRKRLIPLSSQVGDVESLAGEGVDAPCMHYNCTYVSVTPKLSNVPSEWPLKAILVPGNEVIFSLETASDYLTEYNKTTNEDSRFGYRCLCVGYEDAPYTSKKQGLVALESELIYTGAACASRLLAPDLEIPPLTLSTVVEVQVLAMMGSTTGTETETSTEGRLLSKGLELSSPPTIHHVLAGQPLLRCESTERQFLCDFVAGAEETAGGRLARWLAPTPRVEPCNCELMAPRTTPRPANRVSLPVVVRDQYGEIVASPALKVEVVVQRLEDVNATSSRASIRDKGGRGKRTTGGIFQTTVRDTMCFQSITMMKAYQNFSFEELRLESGTWGDVGPGVGSMISSGRVPAERLPVRVQSDGSYVAIWTPRAPGGFIFRCTVDDLPVAEDLTIQVAQSSIDGSEESEEQAEDRPATPPSRVRRFTSRYSQGLRVRASPSLQAEELGLLPPGANIGFVEEVVNKDGTWVRLSEDSVRAYADPSIGVAWCLQHHRHLDRALLVPVEPESPSQLECTGYWSGYGDATGDMQSWTHEEDIDIAPDDFDCIEDKKEPQPLQNEIVDEVRSERRSNIPFWFGAEPSKRARHLRNETLAAASPKRSPRRSNGNSGESWSPLRQRSSDNIRDVNTILETEIEPEPEHRSRVTQTGTQTSPEGVGDVGASTYLFNKEGNHSPKPVVRECIAARSRVNRRSSSPPPLPARFTPAAPVRLRKYALSPAQMECLRSIFAAMLWHEGIVHDAIACAAFLKFHPELPKQGARVVTRTPHEVTSYSQRHSVEVTNAGQYLSINNPATLETLTRSGAEASASRMRKTDFETPIKEEDAQAQGEAGATSSVVNVLPPALRALVALWDALNDADQLASATDKFRNETAENNENDDRPFLRKKRDLKSGSPKTPYSVRCELCGGLSVPPPLAAHMRHAHPGCRGPSSKGYDRAGTYKRADQPTVPATPVPVCGQLAQAYQLWYIYCEKCREKALKAASSIKQSKQKSVSDLGYERIDPIPEIDHHTMKDNALFLLDLAPLTSSEPIESDQAWGEGSGRSPPSQPGSLWQPAPPFQSMSALGAAPKAPDVSDAARFHSLGRTAPPLVTPLPRDLNASSQVPRVYRSLSMGQAGPRDLAQAAGPLISKNAASKTEESLSASGSSLLAQPSAALQKLVGCGEVNGEGCSVSAFESPQVDSEVLVRSPVISFILSRRDLHAYRQKMDAAVRINTVRQYAFEALNWFLRSTTQPISLHDVMWWFCNALDKFAHIVPPPLAIDDNREQNASNEPARVVPPTASASAICPGGVSARLARAAFHSFLGSVSTLTPSLPAASAVSLQAVRCWALHYSSHDRAFFHRSQVFNVISKILSNAEDSAYEEGVLGTLHESVHSYHNLENYVWNCPDVTGWCDITVSSRQGMAGALTDGSTETFWESGEEDRNKSKWVQVIFPGGSPNDRPHIICVHVDNTRDTANKTLLASFLYSGGSSEMIHIQDIEVDPKAAAWLCYTMPRVSSPSVRVRCELRGPEPSVRVRQVRVLAAPAPHAAAAASPLQVLHSISEFDTLKVFRLLTSQVFGKLLECETSGSEAIREGAAAAVDDGTTNNDSDLREHVVGILFAGHKLTSLQRQVMSHIVCAIGSEAARVRDDWETALLCAEADRADDQLPRIIHQQDNYCFEMLSLLLALSGSAVGRAHLAQGYELVPDLLSLLHTGSERVQRQVMLLLRRLIMEINPQKMLAIVNVPNDMETRITLLDYLLSYVGKAITVQVKVKGAGSITPSPVTLGSSVTPAPPAAWFMRGETTKDHAHLISKLLSDMAEDKVSAAWGPETRKSLADYVTQTAQMAEADRRPERCIALPTIWMALAALCVCEQSHIELLNSSDEGRDGQGRDSGGDERPYCTNHDDGATVAIIDCRVCGSLCAECDRFLHLNRAARTHQRQICKEEESAVRIDIHEGCGRAKLFWLFLLVDRRTLKALAEFRGLEDNFFEGATAADEGNAPRSRGAFASNAGLCRFCGGRGRSGLLAIENVCSDPQCQEHGREACSRTLGCGHMCGGVRGERTCLPCLFGCGGTEAAAAPLRQDADDMCMICFTDPLQAAPAIQLHCGHVFHLHCCKKVLINKWNGPRITFSFSQCPICKEDINHWILEELLTPIRNLRDEVKRKAVMRFEFEGSAAAPAGRGKLMADPATYAMERYAYYVCHKCGKAYFGGLARCEVEFSGAWEPSELVCGACSDVAGARTCPKHGADFLEYKCRYCCSVAVFFCFGTSHFCNPCHDDFQRVTNMSKNMLPQCPAGPKAEQLSGTSEDCPLHIEHPPTGEEFALGCGVCRHSHTF